ncbi:MAG: autotransporter domain-containing protein [Selenomonadaceae bacterium]|nr:autotransporter domain-containing protein [Selenomonadaceae bacterium]
MKKSNKSKLSLVIALYLAASVNFSAVDAMTTSDVGFDGKNIFEIYYYGAEDAGNESAKNYFKTFEGNPLVYTLKDDIKAGLNESFRQWAEILGPGAKNNKPVQFFVGTSDVTNAFARSNSRTYGFNTNNPNFLHDAIQNGSNIEWIETVDSIVDGSHQNSAAIGFGRVLIGQNIGKDEGDGRYGFVTSKALLPVAQEMNGIDITPVMFHEIGHSLGISVTRGVEKNIWRFTDGAANANSFTAHLYDQTGRRADKSGLYIMTSEKYEDYMNNGTPEDIQEYKGNTFIVDDMNAFTGRNGKTYLTFRGDNVTEVLDGKTFTDLNGNQVSGIPINMWEPLNEKEIFPEFSHIDLERSLMSHQNYRSYNTFMEAELALMQDIGYKIDRKNFYGRSIYNSGQTLTNTQGYSARNSDGTAYVDGYNTATYGVGLHVYGSNNNITQAGNIYAGGDASVGVRVDGVNNTVTVAKGTEVHGDGKYGTGVFAAYGKNHTINIDGTVTANGEGGVGVWAEFGTNSLGATTEYRGSYMRYKREVEKGQITKMYNLGLNAMNHRADDFSFSDLQNGDLNDKMATINVNGSIEAADSAIFIGEESFVDNINLNEGAKLKGNITNDWKNFSADSGISDSEVVTEDKNNRGNTIYTGGLMLQYDGKLIPYKKYVPSLVTNINVNADMAYDGNINGAENTKLNVNSGTLLYSGEADVVNVTVAKNAAVLGGSYTVNDMTSKMADGYSDDTTGQFINHGTIGAADKNSVLTIAGNGDNDAKLISDGTLAAIGGGSNGNIEVDGTANVEGSAVTAVNYLPDETGKVLTASKGITGNIANSSQSSGMMNTEIKQEDANNLVVTAVEANNLGDTTSEQNETLNAMNAMRKTLRANGDANGLNEMRVLYNMDASSAKQTLTDIGGSSAADIASITQQNSAASNAIGERLNTAFDIPRDNNLNNDIWVNIGKHWGDTRNGANYHGTAIAGGYDKAINKNWRLGAFVGYNSMGFSGKNNGGNAYDTRVGVYGLYKKGAADAYIYANVGWLRNTHRRGIPTLGLSGEAKSGGHIYELGGEYKQELHNNQKLWRVSPYFNMQLSQLRQGGYGEEGLGIYNHHTDSLSNTYFAGQIGLEMKRVAKLGSYGARIGVKHAFSGAEPSINYHFEGDPINSHRLFNKQDKTHFVLRLFGDVNLAQNWTLAGDARLLKGSHDKDIAASITLKKLW